MCPNGTQLYRMEIMVQTVLNEENGTLVEKLLKNGASFRFILNHFE
jgi:hypothetical protein